MKTTRPVLPAPVTGIRTSRLFLRQLLASDIDEFFVIRSDPVVMYETTIGLPDADISATIKWMDRFMPPNDVTNLGVAIFELGQDQPNDGRLVGSMGIMSSGPPEVGYTLRRDAWGKGYATEALRAFLEYYWSLSRKDVTIENDLPGLLKGHEDENFSIPERLVARIEVRNKPSCRVVEKCGFKLAGKSWSPAEHELDHRGPATLIWYYLEKP